MCYSSAKAAAAYAQDGAPEGCRNNTPFTIEVNHKINPEHGKTLSRTALGIAFAKSRSLQGVAGTDSAMQSRSIALRKTFTWPNGTIDFTAKAFEASPIPTTSIAGQTTGQTTGQVAGQVVGQVIRQIAGQKDVKAFDFAPPRRSQNFKTAPYKASSSQGFAEMDPAMQSRSIALRKTFTWPHGTTDFTAKAFEASPIPTTSIAGQTTGQVFRQIAGQKDVEAFDFAPPRRSQNFKKHLTSQNFKKTPHKVNSSQRKSFQVATKKQSNLFAFFIFTNIRRFDIIFLTRRIRTRFSRLPHLPTPLQIMLLPPFDSLPSYGHGYGQSAASRAYSRSGYVPQWTKPRHSRKTISRVSWKNDDEKADEMVRILLGTGSIYDPRGLLFLPVLFLCLVAATGGILLEIFRPLILAAHRRALDHARSELRRTPTENPYKHKKFESFNPPPSPEALLELWIHRKDSRETALAFGSALNDLEATIDNRSISTGPNCWRGRRPGLKGWLRENCPDVAAHYDVALRLKRIAQHLRDASEITDPCPPDWLLPHPGTSTVQAAATIHRRLPFAYRHKTPHSPSRWIYHRHKTTGNAEKVRIRYYRSRLLSANLLAESSNSLTRLENLLRFLLGLTDIAPETSAGEILTARRKFRTHITDRSIRPHAI